MAENTAYAYSTGVNSFEKFRVKYALPLVWPPTVEQMVLYISWLSLQGLSHSTARLYITAIGYQCKVYNAQDVTRNFIIQKVLEGLKRSINMREPRLPITRNVLESIVTTLPAICSDVYESYLFCAAYCLAFAAFLRVSELAVKSKMALGNVLSASDVVFSSEGDTVTILLRYSKNDQYGKGVSLQIKKTGARICAYTNLSNFLHRRPRVGGPLFCHLNGDPLTRYQFSSVLKKCLAVRQLDYGKFTAHSFRIGAATTAAMAGYPVDIIKSAGRWRSGAYKVYLKPEYVVSLPVLTL